MALIKEYELANGVEAPNAYHVVSNVITKKIPVDVPDPGGVRPENSPDFEWRRGYYGRVCIEVFYNQAARDAGKQPIAQIGVYPTDMTADLRVEFRNETNLWFTIDLDSELNVIDQAYAFLKTTQYYSDAEEV